MTIHRRSWIFSLIIIASVVSSFSITGGVAVAWLWLWLGSAVWLTLGKTVWPKGALPNLMLAFLIWISASVWWSHFPYSSWYSVLIFSAIPLSFIAWQLTPYPDEVWGHLKKLYVPAVSVVSLWGVYQVAFLGLPRALGPVADPNVYACLLNLAWFPLLAAFFNPDSARTKKNGLRRLVLGVSLFIVGLAFFAAASRGATLAWLLLMPLAFWAFRSLPNFRKNASISLLLILVSYFIVAAIVHTQLIDRANVDYLTQDASVAVRLLIWRTTVDMFTVHPWLGTGLGSWGGIYPAYRQAEDNSTAGYYAHNDYLQIAQEGGVITFVLFMLIFFLLAVQCIRAVSSTKQQPFHVENVGLMLGVMAAYLHASVNFIFYLVYLNIIVGIYAARAWRSGMASQGGGGFELSNAINPVLQRLVILFVLAIPMTQIVLHEASEIFLNGHSRTLALLRKQFPQLTPYEIARFVTAIRPHEYIAQRYIVDSAAQALGEVEPRDTLLKQEILSEAIERYDELRRNSVNSAEIGALEANFILGNRDLMPGNSAIHKARSVARTALESDSRQVDSIIAMAETYFLEGNQADGYVVLSDGISRMIFLRDRLILQAELLKYQVPSEEALGEIQRKLKNIRFACKVGECLGNRGIEKTQQAQLSEIANSIMPISNLVIKKGLESLINKSD